MKVAIDGPAGSGKSTVCKILASKYNLTYLDTGAMYRAVAYCSNEYGEDYLGDKLRDVEFIFSNQGKNLTLKINNDLIDVTDKIRTPHISSIVSKVAAIKEVRDVLTKKQQEIAKKFDIIMEGRDITTVVLKDAEVKIFLTACVEERAKRRFEEWQNKDDRPAFEEVLESIKKRDDYDSSREVAPLKKADDAIEVDTTGKTLDEVSNIIGKIIEDKLS